MRIRTVKPSFWKSETLASVSKDHRLLAIALLNYADDEGYFFANEALIRGECFPFDEDFQSIRGGLQELSRIGYIALGNTSDGHRIGRLPNFLDHQRIDKASASKIKEKTITWDDSTKAPRILQEPSHPEVEVEVEKGRETNNAPVGASAVRSKSKPTDPPELPSWVPEMQWRSWIEARTKARKPPTAFALRLALAKLDALREQGHHPAAVLAQSAMNNWADLFPVKEARG